EKTSTPFRCGGLFFPNFLYSPESAILVKNAPNNGGKIKEKSHLRKNIFFYCATSCQHEPSGKTKYVWLIANPIRSIIHVVSSCRPKKNSRQKVSGRLFLSGRSFPTL
ncbi:MAG: hypothetical protein WCD70_11555, partial [Alphaproteobacteria bacterium]